MRKPCLHCTNSVYPEHLAREWVSKFVEKYARGCTIFKRHFGKTDFKFIEDLVVYAKNDQLSWRIVKDLIKEYEKLEEPVTERAIQKAFWPIRDRYSYLTNDGHFLLASVIFTQFTHK